MWRPLMTTDADLPGVDPADAGLVVGEGHDAVPPHRSTDSIRVVSWNIQFGVNVEAATRELAEYPAMQDADIILLQEMDEVGTAAMAASLSLNWVYAAPGVHKQSGRNFGNAVLSPWPLGTPDVVRLPYKSAVNGQVRVLVHTDVTVCGMSIDVGSVHTEVPSLSSPKRLRQFDQIGLAASSWPNRRLVIGGDFNTITKRGVRAVAERMAAVGAERVTEGVGPTLRRRGQEFALDHVFARGLRRIDAGVVHGTTASDHRPLWVMLGADEPSETPTSEI